MIKNYALEPMLYEACLSLMDTCFPGIKQIADQGKLHNAHWDKVSTPFCHYVDNELVGHLGLIPFHLVINNQPCTAAALHGICVKEAFRRQGIFTELMNEAMLQVKQHYDLAFLFADSARLYEPFGFKKIDEFDFVLENIPNASQPHAIRKLDLDNKVDVNIIHTLLSKRLPISHRFGIVTEQVVFTLDTLSKQIYYSEMHQMLIVYEVTEDTLYLQDIVFSKPIDLLVVFSMIPESYSKVVLQFCPDNFKSLKCTSIPIQPEDFLMVSASVDLGESLLRFPETGRC